MVAEPVRPRRISLRAELVRLGTRLIIKPASRGRSLAASRRTFRFMARLAPPPPRGTKTTHVDAGGVPAESIVRPGALAGRHVLYLHGGGYCLGSPANYRHFSWRIADAARAPVLAIAYRLAPEHPFPAALEDALTAYRWLIGRGAKEIVVMGESAGGGLVLALLMKLRDQELPLPAAAVAISPWTDLALTGASLADNADADPMLNTSDLPEFVARLSRPAPTRAILTSRRSTATRPGCRRCWSWPAAMRSCATTPSAWARSCAAPTRKATCRCGRAWCTPGRCSPR